MKRDDNRVLCTCGSANKRLTDIIRWNICVGLLQFSGVSKEDLWEGAVFCAFK